MRCCCRAAPGAAAAATPAPRGDQERGDVDQQHSADADQRQQRGGDEGPERLHAVGAEAESGVRRSKPPVRDQAGTAARDAGWKICAAIGAHRHQREQPGQRQHGQADSDRHDRRGLHQFADDHDSAQVEPVAEHAGQRPQQRRCEVADQQERGHGERLSGASARYSNSATRLSESPNIDTAREVHNRPNAPFERSVEAAASPEPRPDEAITVLFPPTGRRWSAGSLVSCAIVMRPNSRREDGWLVWNLTSGTGAVPAVG